MRHFRSILYAVVLAPAAWILVGAGLTRDLTTRGRSDFAVESATGLLLLVLAGAAYGILLFAPISPAGPSLAGLVFLGIAGWALAAPSAYAGVWPAAVTKEGFDLSRPGYGLAALLAVPLVATALSARRWARYEPPVLPIIGQIGRARGAAAVAGTPIAGLETAVLGDAEPTTVLRPAGADRSEDTTVIRTPAGLADDATIALRTPPAESDGEVTTALATPPAEPDDEATTALGTPPATAEGESAPETAPAGTADEAVAEAPGGSAETGADEPETDAAVPSSNGSEPDEEPTAAIAAPEAAAPEAAATDEPAVATDEPAVATDEPAVATDEPAVATDEPAEDEETTADVAEPAAADSVENNAADEQPSAEAEAEAGPTRTDDEDGKVVGLAPVEPQAPRIELEQTRSFDGPDPDRTRAIPIPPPKPAPEPARNGPIAETTRVIGGPDPDRTKPIPLSRLKKSSASRPVSEEPPAPTTRSLTAPDPETTRALSGSDRAKARDRGPDAEHTTPDAEHTTPDAEQTQAIRRPAAEQSDQTQALRFPGTAERGKQMAGPGEQTRSIPYPGTGDVGGDETQVIRWPDTERTQVLRTGTVKPPGEHTDPLQIPRAGPAKDAQPRTQDEGEPVAEAQPRAEQTSIADVERPDFAEDPTSRLAPPEAYLGTDRNGGKRSMTVTNMERPPDEIAEDTTRLDIPAQRKPTP